MLDSLLVRASYLLVVGIVGCVAAVGLYPRPYLKKAYPRRAVYRSILLGIWVLVSLFFFPRSFLFVAGFVQSLLSGLAFVGVTSVYYHQGGHPVIERVVEYRFGFNSDSRSHHY